jgi:hypothetical protein
MPDLYYFEKNILKNKNKKYFYVNEKFFKKQKFRFAKNLN